MCAVQVNYLTSATSTFLSLQSGLARPYWEVGLTISAINETYDLLAHFEGVDEAQTYVSDNSLTATFYGNAKIENTQKKFGSTSLFCDGVGDYITFLDSDSWDFGSGKFTIHWQEYRTATAGASIVRDSTIAFSPFLLGYNTVGATLDAYMSSDGVGWTIAAGKSMGAATLNTWNHFAVVRNNDTFYIFKNGTQTDTWTSTLTLNANANPLAIGNYNSTQYLAGYIDELIIAKGTALWTSDFTAPSAAWSATPDYSATIGQAYQANNDIISMGSIDREKPIFSSGLSRIIAGDITLTLNNNSGRYSPLSTASIFNETSGTARNYFNSVINVWAGFEDISGTAYTIQRGSFLLTKLQIDSSNNRAMLFCEDAAKLPLQKYVGLPDISGTAITWTSSGVGNTKDIIENLLSAAGLSSGQYNIESGIDMAGYILEEKKISEAIAEVAQANDGFIYTNGKGQVVFEKTRTSVFGTKATDLVVKDTDRIIDCKYTIDVRNLTNRVQVNYTTGNTVSRTAQDTAITNGRPVIINNEAISQGSVAHSIASRVLGQFKVNRTFLEIDNIWLPGLDVGNMVSVTDSNTRLSGVAFEIYRVREDIFNCKTRVDAINALVEKWGVCSDTSAVNCGTVFVDSWHSGFAFLSYDTTTAINPGFDLEGNNNNLINPDFALTGSTGLQGTGIQGIEVPFFAY